MKGGVAILGRVSPSEVIWRRWRCHRNLADGHLQRLMLSSHSLTGQGSEFYTTGDEFIEGDPVVCAEAFHDDVQGLRAQIITCTQTYSDINTSSFSSGAWIRAVVAVPRNAMAFCSSWPSTVPLRSWSYEEKVVFQEFRTWQSSLNSWKPIMPDMSLWNHHRLRSAFV